MESVRSRRRARSALARASTALACASTSDALAWATSSATVLPLKRASTCPRFTVSPTSTSTSASVNELDSDAMLASCQATTSPSATTCTGRSSRFGGATVTTMAGRAWLASPSEADGCCDDDALFPPEGDPDDMSRSGRISIRPPTTSSTSRQPPRKIRTEVDIDSNEKKG